MRQLWHVLALGIIRHSCLNLFNFKPKQFSQKVASLSVVWPGEEYNNPYFLFQQKPCGQQLGASCNIF